MGLRFSGSLFKKWQFLWRILFFWEWFISKIYSNISFNMLFIPLPFCLKNGSWILQKTCVFIVIVNSCFYFHVINTVQQNFHDLLASWFMSCDFSMCSLLLCVSPYRTHCPPEFFLVCKANKTQKTNVVDDEQTLNLCSITSQQKDDNPVNK